MPEFVFKWNKSTISDRKWNRCPLVSKKRSGSCVLLSLSNSCWKKKMRQLCRFVRVITRFHVGVTGSVRCRNFSLTRPACKETMTDPRCRNSTLFCSCSATEKIAVLVTQLSFPLHCNYTLFCRVQEFIMLHTHVVYRISLSL